MIHLSNRVFALAEVQTVYMDSLLMSFRAEPQAESRDLCPRTFQGDTLVTSDIGWWTSGFYPGVLWQMYSLTGKESFHDLAVKHTLPLAGLLEQETDHDIGFQLMSSFAQWEHYDYTHKHEMNVLSAEQLDDILTKGAEKLAARFVPTAGVIRSWNGNRWNIPSSSNCSWSAVTGKSPKRTRLRPPRTISGTTGPPFTWSIMPMTVPFSGGRRSRAMPMIRPGPAARPGPCSGMR